MLSIYGPFYIYFCLLDSGGLIFQYMRNNLELMEAVVEYRVQDGAGQLELTLIYPEFLSNFKDLD